MVDTLWKAKGPLSSIGSLIIAMLVLFSFSRSIIQLLLTKRQLFSKGTLSAHFDPSNKIEMLDIVISEHNEYIPRNILQTAESPDPKQSPKLVKGTGKRAQQQKLQQNQLQASIPESMVTANGFPTAVMGFLEVMIFPYAC